MNKARVIRWILGISGWVLCLILIFCLEQYYRWEVSNFEARDGQRHTYNIYEGTTIDSLLSMISEDYEISAMADLKWHMRILLFLYPEPGHYEIPPQIGDRITFAFQPPKKGKITKRLQKCENNAIKEKKNCTIVRHIKKLT